jgi:hypothetical protein
MKIPSSITCSGWRERAVSGGDEEPDLRREQAKPKIILRDALNNDLKIVENAEHCLAYDRPLTQAGLTWRQLIAWWAGDDQLAADAERDAARNLYRRLLDSMPGNAAERFIFTRYCALYRTLGFDTPALIPQVYLHYDPYTRRAGMPLTRHAPR